MAAFPATGADTVPELYMHRCAVCHLPGIAGAPKVGDRADWTRRVLPGMSAVYRNALEGVPNTAMMAKGGHDDLKDDVLRAIVDYMISAAHLSPETFKAAARYDALRISNRDFIRLDTDFDGFLSRSEIAGDAVLARAYARFDADGDGKRIPGIQKIDNRLVSGHQIGWD